VKSYWLKSIIKVNNQYFAGESKDCYRSNAKGSGWHDFKSGELNVLVLSDNPDDAKVIEGNINLKSVLDKILLRVQDVWIHLNTIEIIKQ